MGALVGSACLTLLVAVPTAAAGIPTLGARLQPAPMVYEVQPWVLVTNLSTVEVRVTLTASDGWQLASDSFSLVPNQSRRVAVVRAAEREGTITAILAPLAPIPDAVETTALRIATTARHQTIVERWGWLGLPTVLLIGLAIVVSARRRRSTP